MYCFGCQNQAPIYNRLFERIENDPNLRGRIKIIGVAAGNAAAEIEAFRDEFGVRFPVFEDPQFEVHSRIGSVRTPFSIFIRQGANGVPGLVAKTRLGMTERYDRLVRGVRALSTLRLNAIRPGDEASEGEAVLAASPIPDKDVLPLVMAGMRAEGGKLVSFEKIEVDPFRTVYTGVVEKTAGGRIRLFAEVIGRPSVCGVCHGVHFFYIFDATGKIVRFVPLQLTKYGNKKRSDADTEKMRATLLGRSILQPFD